MCFNVSPERYGVTSIVVGDKELTDRITKFESDDACEMLLSLEKHSRPGCVRVRRC